MTTLIIDTLATYGTNLVIILSAVVGVGVAYLVFCFGLNAVWHADGTTNWLGSHWSAYDHLTYKPYKNYNRFRSRKWNMSHTL